MLPWRTSTLRDGLDTPSYPPKVTQSPHMYPSCSSTPSPIHQCMHVPKWYTPLRLQAEHTDVQGRYTTCGCLLVFPKHAAMFGFLVKRRPSSGRTAKSCSVCGFGAGKADGSQTFTMLYGVSLCFVRDDLIAPRSTRSGTGPV